MTSAFYGDFEEKRVKTLTKSFEYKPHGTMLCTKQPLFRSLLRKTNSETSTSHFNYMHRHNIQIQEKYTNVKRLLSAPPLRLFWNVGRSERTKQSLSLKEHGTLK